MASKDEFSFENFNKKNSELTSAQSKQTHALSLIHFPGIFLHL